MFPSKFFHLQMPTGHHGHSPYFPASPCYFSKSLSSQLCELLLICPLSSVGVIQETCESTILHHTQLLLFATIHAGGYRRIGSEARDVALPSSRTRGKNYYLPEDPPVIFILQDVSSFLFFPWYFHYFFSCFMMFYLEKQV